MSNSAPQSRPTKRRVATLYDAVAGRINNEGFMPAKPAPRSTHDTSWTSLVAHPPEEVLFRRQGAPERYHEDDVYFQDRHLPALDRRFALPDSDLLKAAHGHASVRYGGAAFGEVSFRSLEGTALLCLGILLEEWAAEEMGRSERFRDFVEGEGEEDRREARRLAEKGSLRLWDGSKWVVSGGADESGEEEEDVTENESSDEGEEKASGNNDEDDDLSERS